MKLLALNEEERKYMRFTHKVTLKYSSVTANNDFTAAALTQTYTIFPTSGALTAKLAVLRAAVVLITPITGGAIATTVIDVGDGGSVGRHIANANTDLFTALATNTKPYVISQTGYIYSDKNISDGNSVLQAKITTTTGNVVAATAGEVDIYLDIADLADLKRPMSFPL
jgi:hypothetical protein